MKILVLNLLRLGDFIQTVPVIHGLAQRHPRARIDVLTFKPVAQLHNMLPVISRWWTLDRGELQAGLGRADIPLLTSYDVLKEQLDAINDENYDLIINLTQTQFAGHIMGYLFGREKLGLNIQPSGRPRFHSPWFRYLDERAMMKAPDIFNYTDLFYQACGLQDYPKQWNFKPTAEGRAEVDDLMLEDRPTLVAQVLTSDSKKNWGLPAWREFFAHVRGLAPNWQFVLLGAPGESAQIQGLARETGAVPAVLTLEGALVLLKRSQLLVTGDTSIMHLANAADISVLELSLGSSDYLRTGIYKADSVILQPKVACSPCPHSGACTQTSQACAEGIGAGLAAKVAVALGARDWNAVAAASTPGIEILRTYHLETGFWFAAPVQSTAAETTASTVEAILERCTSKFVLNQEHKRPLTELGSESVRLQNEIGRLFPGAERGALLAHLNFLEQKVSHSENSAAHALAQLSRTRTTPQFDFMQTRQAQVQIEHDMRQAEIKVKLIRSLKSRLMEST